MLQQHRLSDSPPLLRLSLVVVHVAIFVSVQTSLVRNNSFCWTPQKLQLRRHNWSPSEHCCSWPSP